MGRNSGFASKLCGVTGSEVVVPIASWRVGGSVERSERRDLDGSSGSLCTNWIGQIHRRIKEDGRRTICEFSGNVETCLAPRKNKGALKPGRTARMERAKVFDSISICGSNWRATQQKFCRDSIAVCFAKTTHDDDEQFASELPHRS